MLFNTRLNRYSAFLLVHALIILPGCSDLRYYMQSAQGQWDIYTRKETISDYLQNTNHTSKQDTSLESRLRLVEKIRQFAINDLHLPETGSYTEYADLQRDYVLKNLFAAPRFSTRLHTWCYPIIGCAGYRGYFDETMLQHDKAMLEEKGLETYVAKVAAYSTLGWFDDPVLNTVIHAEESRLAGLVFHELAHQQLYIDDDTSFNESFASAVEQAGIERWFKSRHDEKNLQKYHARKKQTENMTAAIMKLQQRLSDLYKTDKSDEEMVSAKQHIIEQAQQDFSQLLIKGLVPPTSGQWFLSGMNNAKLGSAAAYSQYKQAFLALLADSHYNFPLFYSRVTELSSLDKSKRQQCLISWSEAGHEIISTITKDCLLKVDTH